MIHVRFEGRSFDLTKRELGLNGHGHDIDIKECLARHFDVSLQNFDYYIVEHRPNGDVIVRPEAVYG